MREDRRFILEQRILSTVFLLGVVCGVLRASLLLSGVVPLERGRIGSSCREVAASCRRAVEPDTVPGFTVVPVDVDDDEVVRVRVSPEHPSPTIFLPSPSSPVRLPEYPRPSTPRSLRC